MTDNELALAKTVYEGEILPPKPKLTIKIPRVSMRRLQVALNELAEAIGEPPPYKIGVDIPYNGDIEDAKYQSLAHVPDAYIYDDSQ